MTCYSMGASTSYSAGIEMMIAISICKICMRDLEVWFDSVAYTDVEQTPAYSMEIYASIDVLKKQWWSRKYRECILKTTMWGRFGTLGYVTVSDSR